MNEDRRRFVLKLGSLLLLLPAGRFVSACSNGTSTTTPTPTTQPNQLTFTSSVVENHSHTVQINSADFATPPVGGDHLTTSLAPANGQNHSHMVELTEADLSAIEAGRTVTKTTSLALSHDHTFTFTKTTSSQPTPTPTSTGTTTPPPRGY